MFLGLFCNVNYCWFVWAAEYLVDVTCLRVALFVDMLDFNGLYVCFKFVLILFVGDRLGLS